MSNKKESDIGGKKLISLDPQGWCKWITQMPELQFLEMISSEFQWIARENDVLMKVYSKKTGNFLLLNELQLRYDGKVPNRIRGYCSLAEDKYNLPVYPVLVNILPNSKNEIIPNRYESELMGIKAYQDYQVINLWEVNADSVFTQNLKTLLPFVPILKGGNDETIIRRATRMLQTDEDLNQLEPLLSFFATFVLDTSIVQQIMRWDMTVLRESPWYLEILKEGRIEGKTEGRIEGKIEGLQEGKIEGLQEGESNLVLRQIRRRFGELEPIFTNQIRSLSVEQLDELGESLFDFSTMTDLINWLENHQ